MTDEEKEASLKKLSIVELKLRLSLATKIIREAQRDGDGRWENVVPQQRRLNKVLVRKLKERRLAKGKPEPPPIVVGVKAAKMVARRPFM